MSLRELDIYTILKKVNVALVVYFSIFQLTESRSSWNQLQITLWRVDVRPNLFQSEIK